MSSEVILEDASARKLLNGLIKNVGQISNRAKAYVGILSSVVIRDIIDHFEKQESDIGKWKPWSASYRKYMISIGKGGNLILSNTGKLRQGWQPARYRVSKEGVLWFNPVEYASKHNEGIPPFPQRKFTWLSEKALNDIETQTVKFIEDIK